MTIIGQEVKSMSNPKYYIVEAAALPEVFLKVAEAKRLLATGEASTVNDATRQTGISRSAFYKYRDSILPLQNLMAGRIITFQCTIYNEPGVLNTVLTVFAKYNANLITVSSSIPNNGCATVTISAETAEMTGSLEQFLQRLRDLPGILKADILAG